MEFHQLILVSDKCALFLIAILILEMKWPLMRGVGVTGLTGHLYCPQEMHN
jgi:hypothetical protein